MVASYTTRFEAQLSTGSPPRLPPGLRGPLNAYSRRLQLGTSGKVFCLSCPGRPRTLSPHAEVQALWAQGPRWRSLFQRQCLSCGLLRALCGLRGSAALSLRPSASPAHPLRDAGSCLPLPGPEARLGLSHPGVAYVPGAPGTVVASRLPENVSPAAVSKSPAKVTRQVPSVLMVLSTRRAASGRRRPVASGSQGRPEPKLQAARVDATAAKHQTPKWQQLHKSEVPRLPSVGTGSWTFLPSRWLPFRVWRRRERERRARPRSPNPRWDPVMSPPKRYP